MAHPSPTPGVFMQRSPAILLPLALGLITGVALLTKWTDPGLPSTSAAMDRPLPGDSLAGKSAAEVLATKAPALPDQRARQAEALAEDFPGDAVQDRRFGMTLPDGRAAAG